MAPRVLLILLLLLPVALTPRVEAASDRGERAFCCVGCDCGERCPCTADEPAERPAPEPYAPTRGPELAAVASKASAATAQREPSRPIVFAPARDERAGLVCLPVLARLCVWRN